MNHFVWRRAWRFLFATSLVVSGCSRLAVPSASVPSEGAGNPKPPRAATVTTQSDNGKGMVIEVGPADAETLNPILMADNVSANVADLMYLKLVGVDPQTGAPVPEIAESWTFSADGRKVTFHLRDGMEWSDGKPLTARDVQFTLDAIASDLVNSPAKGNVERIAKVRVVDDLNLDLYLTDIDCTVVPGLTQFGILPAHLFAADFSDIMESPENDAPSVVSGPFKFVEWQRDDHITLLRNPTYYKGAPKVDGWIYRILPDAPGVLNALDTGDADIGSAQPEQISDLGSRIRGGAPLRIATFESTSLAWLGMNMADPQNPQPGWTDLDGNGAFDEGEPDLTQTPHPVLGDIAVRRAIAQAIDYEGIIGSVVYGQGRLAVSNVVPAFGWAYNDALVQVRYDPTAAAALLAQAGWRDSDGDGKLERQGRPLKLRLLTNAGNTVRTSIATILSDNMERLGFQIEMEILEFGAVIDKLLGQDFDLVVFGTDSPPDPDDSSSWRFRDDFPGEGGNFVSYQSPAVERLFSASRSATGCDRATRGELFKQIQRQLFEDLPYVFLYIPLDNRVWSTRLHGLDPGPWSMYHNIETWTVDR